ncbi:MAG: bifunctional diaminohydroxyphosphoribosylaminopyrimidine deaminase/5-amino-6-(5-phosphoribosylamino)uracil reductase RibD [Actinomycetota bacterium]
MTDDERYMARALELARSPQRPSPNPRVGAVVVRDDRVIGEGAHFGSGHDHAEAMALDGIDASGATLYVNLEPCNHTGKRPPCVPLVSASGVGRVVIAHADPDERVAGRGIAHLRAAAVDVTVGVAEAAARRLNAPYIWHRATGRPWLTLKLAMSLDGRMAAPDGSSRWITGTPARRWVHRRRAEADVVLVGAGTVLADDPSLTSRLGENIVQPLRAVIDGRGSIDAGAKVFDDAAETLIVTTSGTHEAQLAWKEAGAEVVVLPADGRDVDLGGLLDLLGRRGVLEVYCEGGAGLATALLADGLPNRLEFFYAPMLLGGRGPALGELGLTTIAEAQRFETVDVERFGDDVLMIMERVA